MKRENIYVGDRIVVVGSRDSFFYSTGASGVVVDIDEDGDYLVRFDSGRYFEYCDQSWFVQEDEIEVVRERDLEGVK